jgi:hypothetical protein
MQEKRTRERKLRKEKNGVYESEVVASGRNQKCSLASCQRCCAGTDVLNK